MVGPPISSRKIKIDTKLGVLGQFLRGLSFGRPHFFCDFSELMFKVVYEVVIFYRSFSFSARRLT